MFGLSLSSTVEGYKKLWLDQCRQGNDLLSEMRAKSTRIRGLIDELHSLREAREAAEAVAAEAFENAVEARRIARRNNRMAEACEEYKKERDALQAEVDQLRKPVYRPDPGIIALRRIQEIIEETI